MTVISLAPGSLHEVAKASLEADRLATGYLKSLLVPLAIGFSLRMLIVERHISWYSTYLRI